jgi:hypothetical protein
VKQGPERKPLLEGRGGRSLAQVASLTRIRMDDIAALAESNSLSGAILNGDRTAWGFFEDQLPSREILLELGARPLGESEPDPVDDSQPAGSATWEIRW